MKSNNEIILALMQFANLSRPLTANVKFYSLYPVEYFSEHSFRRSHEKSLKEQDSMTKKFYLSTLDIDSGKGPRNSDFSFKKLKNVSNWLFFISILSMLKQRICSDWHHLEKNIYRYKGLFSAFYRMRITPFSSYNCFYTSFLLL